jgi:hypothetical protein
LRPAFARAPLWSALFVTLFPRVASAAPADAQTAEALFQSAKEAMAHGDVPVACARFAESVRLDPAVGGLLNLADCETRLGKLASALAHFQEARDRIPPDDSRLVFVVDRIAALGPRVPHLTVRIRAADLEGATVLRDETELGTASLGVGLPVDPGAHVLVLRAPGHADARQSVTLREGEARSIELALGPPVVLTSAVGESTEAPPPAGRAQHVIALTLGGAGLVSVTTGAIVGVIAKSTYDEARSHCPTGPTSCTPDGVSGGQRAYDEATAATIALVAGGVLVAAGFTLYLTAPHTVSVTPAVGGNAAGLSVVGTW